MTPGDKTGDELFGQFEHSLLYCLFDSQRSSPSLRLSRKRVHAKMAGASCKTGERKSK
jgi:hypothetical protein